MKKLLCLLTLLALIIGSLPISAAGGEVSVTVNGKDVVFDQPPIIESGRTLVPMRAIFEALGYEVVWDNGTIDVYNSDGDNVMTLWVDNKYMWTENADVTLDVAPKIVNSRTLVPVRAISESIGANVVWDNSTRTVIIKYTASDSSKGKCDHDNTTEKVVDTEYEEIDEDSHLCIESIREYCDDCGEIVDSYVVESEESHNFKNGVCRSCGYEETVNLKTPLMNLPKMTVTKANNFSEYVVGDTYVEISTNRTLEENPDLKEGDECKTIVSYTLDSMYKKFTASKIHGDSCLNIYVDGELVFSSPKLSYNSQIPLDIDVDGATTLTFEHICIIGSDVDYVTIDDPYLIK